MSTSLTLSTDINVITAEINAYKQTAGHAIFEIGRRLKHVRDNPEEYGLRKYGDWEKWCERDLSFTKRQANKYVRAFEKFDGKLINGKSTSQLALDVLDLLAGEDDDFVSTPHTVPSTGEVKSVDDMTVRELRDTRRVICVEIT